MKKPSGILCDKRIPMIHKGKFYKSVMKPTSKGYAYFKVMLCGTILFTFYFISSVV